MPTICCQAMAGLTEIDAGDGPSTRTSRPVRYHPLFDEYGLRAHPGQLTPPPWAFCPWCGRALPRSQRARWYRELDDLGLSADDPDLPQRLLRPRWWTRTAD
jgi:hypothetical protein